MIKERIQERFTEEEEQNGFRADCSCIDAIFTLKTQGASSKRSVHVFFDQKDLSMYSL